MIDPVDERIVGTIHEPLLVLDGRFRVRRANRAFCRMFGTSEGEVLGEALFDLGGWNVAGLRTRLERVLEADEPFESYELERSFPEAGHRVLRLNGRSLIREEGQSRAILLAMEDVTGRRELKAERARLAEVFQNTPAWIATMRGTDHVFEMANPTYRQLVGDREVIGRPVREVFPELEDEGYFELLDRVYETGETVEVEERPLPLETEEGTATKYISFVYQPRRQDDEVIGVIAHGVDVTEQVERREQAHKAEEKWATAIELAPTGIVISDAETGRMHAMNEAFEEMFGYPAEEMRGRTSLELDLWDDPERRAEIVAEARDQGSVEGKEARFRTAEGQEGFMRLSCRRLELAGEDRMLWTVQDITEERERHERLHLLESAVRATHHGILVTDREGTIVWANPAFSRMTGYELEEVIGETPRLLKSGEQDEAFYEELWETILAGETWSGEVVNPRKDGTHYVEAQSIVPVRHRSEEITHFVAIREDVTEQKEAERSRARLTAILENTPDYVGIADLQERIVWVNRPGREMLGLPEGATLEGKPIESTHPDWAYERVREKGIPAAVEEGFWRGESALLTREGQEIPVSQILLAHRSEEGELVYLSTIARDVSDRKAREEALRASERRFRKLFEESRDPISITTPGGDFVAANEAFLDLFGYEPGELAALDVQQFYADPADRERFFESVRREGGVTEFEVGLRTKTGEVRTCEISTALIETSEAGQKHLQTIIRDVTDRKRLEEQLEHQALHDPLTGLPNRTLLQDRLEQALARSRREGEPMGLLMLDLDKFKRINDNLGHPAGDQVLSEVAHRFRSAVRETDTVGRWGGDEFVVVLPALTRADQIENLQARLRKRVQKPIRVEGETLQLTVTTGGVVQSEEDLPRTVETEEVDDLFRFVNLALHQAKSHTADRFYRFDPADDLSGFVDLRLEQDLRRGLEAGEIEVFYQPVRHLADGTITKLEALARWRHPERGLVSPGEFIPLAERVGLIGQVGASVARQSYRQLAAWDREGASRSDLRVAHNLSARELQDPGFADTLRGWLDEAGLGPERIVIEVTETVLMRSPGQIRAIRDLGADVFIDDFGTQYSTYTYLRELDVQGLKIDMSFVQGLPESTSDLAIVESICTLAHRLGLEVIAEGIEEEKQLDALRKVECTLGQGFYLGRPQPAEEVVRQLPS